MKKIKVYKLILIICLLLPLKVKAGSISFNDPIKISNDTYSFNITINDLQMNYLTGDLAITNGKITKITMKNEWQNHTGLQNHFYFYRSGILNGSYEVATIEVKMTGNSEYTVNNLDYGANKCTKENGRYFNNVGKWVTEEEYNKTCNHDNTLKGLSLSVGKLAPAFDSAIYYYNVVVPPTTPSITFNPVVNNPLSKIMTPTTCALNDTINRCPITIKSASGDLRTYIIMVSRVNNTIPSPKVTDFKVYGGSLSPSFQENVTIYTITPNENATHVYFSFLLNGNYHETKKCKIEDTAACNLTVTINEESKKYTFYIKGNSKEENPADNNNQNTNKNNNSNQNNGNANITNKKPSTENKKNPVKDNTAATDKNTEADMEEETKDPIEYDKNNSEKEEPNKEENKTTEKKSPKEDKKSYIDTKFIIILFVINSLLGIAIGYKFSKYQNR